jgi:hypothetical protein
MGVHGNFGPGTPLSAIIEYVKAHVDPQRMRQELSPLRADGPNAAEGSDQPA